VSNAARPDREAVHNRAYWKLAPYLGLGPSAHSFDGVARWWNEPAYARWQRLLAQGKSAVAGHELLNDNQRRLEQTYLGLRTREGIALPEPCPTGLRQALERWVAAGWAELEVSPAAGHPSDHAPAPPGARARLTPQGWLRLDELVAII
jgi:coproporphyrinogen III oxidase-like Fe-S oxidoreductase